MAAMTAPFTPCFEDFVAVNSTDFAVDVLLQNLLQKDHDLEDDLFDLRDLSPLTTAPSSPCDSPTQPHNNDIPSYQQPFHPELLDVALEELSKELFGLDDLSSPSSSDSSRHPSLTPIITPTPLTALAQSHKTLVQCDGEIPATTVGAPRRKRKKKIAKDKAKGHQNRKKKRLQLKAETFSAPTRAEVVDAYVRFDQAIPTGNNAKQAVTTKGSYIAGRSAFEENRIYTLDDLVGPGSSFGLQLVAWDGRTPKPIIDAEGRVIGILAGRPGASDWDEVMKEAVHHLEEARQLTNASVEEHRRGLFPSLRCGISHGGGQPKPGNLCNTRTNEQILDNLNKCAPFKRISGFTSSVFATWAPNLYEYYQKTYIALLEKYPRLTRTFPESVFCATTYNLGPQTVCFSHTDFANLPFGWCAITALGEYNPMKGGHLVLWNCGLVVEFPPGSSVLIPSAIVAHSNTAIGVNETRYSFTQYTAGGVFRWVEHGFKKRKDFLAGLKGNALEVWKEMQEKRWEWGLSLFRQVPQFQKQSTL